VRALITIFSVAKQIIDRIGLRFETEGFKFRVGDRKIAGVYGFFSFCTFVLFSGFPFLGKMAIGSGLNLDS
jgi:hypothetical protein